MNQANTYLQIRLLVLVLLVLPGMALSSCIDPIIEQERNVEPFTGIKVGGAFNLVLNQTGKHKLLIEAEEDLLDKIRTEVKRDVLHIEMKWDWSWRGNDEVTIYISFKDLESLNVSGAGDVSADTPIKAENLDIRVSGAGDVDLEVDAKSMDVEVSGAGDVKISGSTNSQKVRLSGAGDYKAQDMKSQYTHAKASGAGTAVVFASKEIEAYASGAGSVKYYGDPEKERTDSSGAGSISRR